VYPDSVLVSNTTRRLRSRTGNSWSVYNARARHNDASLKSNRTGEKNTENARALAYPGRTQTRIPFRTILLSFGDCPAWFFFIVIIVQYFSHESRVPTAASEESGFSSIVSRSSSIVRVRFFSTHIHIFMYTYGRLRAYLRRTIQNVRVPLFTLFRFLNAVYARYVSYVARYFLSNYRVVI